MEIKDLVSQIDIVDYVSQYVDLRSQNGEYFGLCPFHNEKTASFSIIPSSSRFYCFGCGASGDVLDFAKAYHHLSTPAAIDHLKQYAGITEGNISPVCSMLRIARKFQQHPTRAATPHTFLSSDIMDRYEDIPEKYAVWIKEGISEAQLKRFGVRYDRFSDRLVFPIRTPDGAIFNVSGRTLDPDFKEKGLRKYTYFYKMGVLDTLYGLYENRDAILKAKEIILFEGAKSVMLASTYGVQNCAAVLTSHLNPFQTKILIELSVKVVFAFDSDIDPRQDSEIQKLMHFVPCEWVRNRDQLLAPKMAPVDAGVAIWKQLYERRERL